MNYWAISEKVAVGCGLWSVWLERSGSIFLYPIGIISVCIYIILCYHTGLYADMIINFFYFIMSLYGWWRWYKASDGSRVVSVTRLTPHQQRIWIGVSLCLWILLYLWLKNLTDSTVPVIDSFTTALAFVGMILLAERKLENWLYWIVTDIFSIPLFYYKELYTTSFQFFVFTIVAVSGYIRWKKLLREELFCSSLHQALS